MAIDAPHDLAEGDQTKQQRDRRGFGAEGGTLDKVALQSAGLTNLAVACVVNRVAELSFEPTVGYACV